MMKTRRSALTSGAAAVGLTAAAFLSTAIAAADDYVYEPDGSTFVELPGSQTGFHPSPIELPPLFDQQTGTEAFNIVQEPSGLYTPNVLAGNVLITDFLGVTETQFDETVNNTLPGEPGALDVGSQITLWQLPLGFSNELIVSNSVPTELEDFWLTPFGDFSFLTPG